MPKPTAHRITIRLTGEEYAELRAKAGSTPLSTFLREAALTQSATMRKAPVKPPKADQRALAQILALLCQADSLKALRNINSIAFDDPALAEARIQAAQDDLGTIKALLMLALEVAPL
ncbi:MAG: hypothetical protein ACPGNV_05230 [Mangrovicoccus sp.]